jgi:hypothetical protein
MPGGRPPRRSTSSRRSAPTDAEEMMAARRHENVRLLPWASNVSRRRWHAHTRRPRRLDLTYSSRIAEDLRTPNCRTQAESTNMTDEERRSWKPDWADWRYGKRCWRVPLPGTSPWGTSSEIGAYPLTTPSGMRRATFLASPALSYRLARPTSDEWDETSLGETVDRDHDVDLPTFSRPNRGSLLAPDSGMECAWLRKARGRGQAATPVPVRVAMWFPGGPGWVGHMRGRT